MRLSLFFLAIFSLSFFQDSTAIAAAKATKVAKANKLCIGVFGTWVGENDPPDLSLEKGVFCEGEKFEKSNKYQLISVDGAGKRLETRNFDFLTENAVAKCLPGTKDCSVQMQFKTFIVTMKDLPSISEIQLFKDRKMISKLKVKE